MVNQYIERGIKNALITKIRQFKHAKPTPYTDILADAIIAHIANDYGTVDVGVDYWKNKAKELEVDRNNLQAILKEYQAKNPPLFDEAHSAPKSVIPKESKAPIEAKKPKQKRFFSFK